MKVVAVLEDEPELLAMVLDLLHTEGYLAVGIPHPRDLERHLAEAQPDVLVVDVMLPGISGIEVARLLRERGHGDLPLVAMSASRLMVEYAAASGLFREVLAKPFAIDAFLACLERLGRGSRTA
jgi:DNA-binding response OmpR family regulator